jgi:hypothetical protein
MYAIAIRQVIDAEPLQLRLTLQRECQRNDRKDCKKIFFITTANWDRYFFHLEFFSFVFSDPGFQVLQGKRSKLRTMQRRSSPELYVIVSTVSM